MTVNLDNVAPAYLEPTNLSWLPRPGLDLDGAIRVMRTNPLSTWKPVIPQINQYDQFQNGVGLVGLLSTLDHRVTTIADQFGNPQGPIWGSQPDEAVRWPWDVLNGLEKIQYEDLHK